MGIFDKAKDVLSEHSEHVDKGIERIGDLIDEKTGDKYADKVDQGQELAGDKLQDYVAKDPEKPA